MALDMPLRKTNAGQKRLSFYGPNIWSKINPSYNPANTCLDEDVFRLRLQMTSSRLLDLDEYIRLTHTSSEDVFKTSSRRLDQDQHIHVSYTSSRRLQDVFKTSCKYVFKTPCKNVLLRRFEDVLQKRLQDIFKTSSRHLQEVLLRHFQDFLQKRLQDIFKTSCQDVFKTS